MKIKLNNVLNKIKKDNKVMQIINDNDLKIIKECLSYDEYYVDRILFYNRNDGSNTCYYLDIYKNKYVIFHEYNDASLIDTKSPKFTSKKQMLNYIENVIELEF